MNFLPDVLLQNLEEGGVIPVVGQTLSVVPVNGRLKTVNQLMAERLAAMLAIPMDRLPPHFTLSDVVFSCPDYRSDPSTLHAMVKRAFARESIPVPKPLRQLAEIPTFRFFATTSFDGLLEQALKEQRGLVHRFTYFPNAKPWEWQIPADGTILFELMGHVTTTVDEFTLTEDDLLEFAHAMQAEGERGLPTELLAILKRHHLLLIGNAFPDWLARFFLRALKNLRLRERRNYKEFIVDATVREDAALMEFLKCSSGETTVIPTSDVLGFVDALHAHWKTEGSRWNLQASSLPLAKASKKDEQLAVVFLSYAHEDQPAALQVKQQLDQLGWTVWLDQAGGLEGGDDYERKIQRQIQKCDVFMPLLSRHTETAEDRFFRMEWGWAIRSSLRFTGLGREFIIPVPLEAISEETALVPEEFRAKHWVATASGGVLPAEFLDTMRSKLRQIRRK